MEISEGSSSAQSVASLGEWESDNEDPSYTPEREAALEKRKRIPDYFNIGQYKKSAVSVVVPPTANTNRLEEDDICCSELDSSSTISTYNTPIHTLCPYLDGQFFKIIGDVCKTGKLISAQCQKCLPKETVIKGCVGVSTNFLKHLRKVHGEKVISDYQLYKQNKKSTKPTTTSKNFESKISSVQCQPKITNSFKRSGIITQNEFDKRIIKFIVNTMSAVAVVDNPSFVEIFDGMHLNVISRRTAIRQIKIMFEKNCEMIKSALQNVKYVTTTADIWSAKRRSFFGVTCHWLDENLDRHSVALACKRFSGSHTYDKIGELLEDIHLKFNLNVNKIVATITDNGSNFVKAFKEFEVSVDIDNDSLTTNVLNLNSTSDSDSDTNTRGDPDQAEDDINDLSFIPILSANEPEPANTNLRNTVNLSLPKHIRCASHTLNLIATTDANKAIQKNPLLRTRHANVMHKCSLLWKMAGKPKSAEIIQATLNHTLSYPVVTRWNSLFESVSQILKDKDKLPILFEKLNIKNSSLKENDINYLTEYCDIFKPLSQTLDMLQGQNQTYFGYLLPCLGSLLKKFDNLKLKQPKLVYTGSILEACHNGLQERFNKYFNLYTDDAKDAIIATVTIPAFKMRWISHFKHTCSMDLNKEIQKLLVEAIQKECGNIENEENQEVHMVLSQVDYEFFEFEDPETQSVSTSFTSGTYKNKIEIEVLQYLSDNSIDLQTIHKYPHIKKLFFRYNTALTSSAPVERLFSFATIINSPKRHALSDKNFEQLVVLKANNKFYCENK